METDAKIDWLSFTIGGDKIPALLTDCTGQFEVTGHGFDNYSQSSTAPSGATLLSGTRQDMGQHVILSGATLETLRDAGNNDRQLSELVLALGGKTSRLDLALDILNSDLIVQDVENAYFSGEMITHARSCERRTKWPSGADTLYIGGRTSDRMLRTYDKAAEMHIVDGTAWIRLELEIHRMRSRATLDALAKTPQTRWVINHALRLFAEWDNDIYRKATDDQDATIADIPRKEPNTLHWLRTQVAPAAAKYQNNNPGVDIRAILSAWITPLLIDLDENQDYASETH